MIKEILEYNKAFVENKMYEEFITSKYPDKKLAVVSCMDTRLTELLPAALGIKNGDAKFIKNAGGVISHPFGSVMRSLLIAVYDLEVTEILIIGHTDCGARHTDGGNRITSYNVCYTKLLRETECKKVIYVSCNPATLARDAKMLRDKGYKIEKIQPVDMFPHTYHVECVAVMIK